MEERLPPPASAAPTSLPLIYDLPGYGGIPSAPLTTSTIVHATTQPPPLPIHSIQFPHSPSPQPFQTSLPHHNERHDQHEDYEDGVPVPRYYKLSFPMFNGKEDPLGWLNRCEQFFRVQRTRETDKVWLASFHMTGAAQHWYFMLERDSGAVSWPLFKQLCHQRFGPAVGINHLANLSRLEFHGSVAEYQEAFLSKMAHAGFLSPAQQVQLFTGGLPDALRVDIELQAPQDLHHAMALARAYEKRSSTMMIGSSGGCSSGSSDNANIYSNAQALTAAPMTPSTVSPATPHPPKPFKCLTPAEMIKQRRQGLCYNCDEQFTRGHQCAHLFYLEVADFVDEEPQVHEESPPLISLHAITGIGVDGTMQVCITIGNRSFTALLDTGSSTNFISCVAADRVGLRVTSSNGVRVRVANGDRVQCCGLARDVTINIGTEMFTTVCYSMPLGSFDMVLGVSFLKKLGPILWDFDDLSMVFWSYGRRVQWNGIGSNYWDRPHTGCLYSVHDDEQATVAIQSACHYGSDTSTVHNDLLATIPDDQYLSKLELRTAFHHVLFDSAQLPEVRCFLNCDLRQAYH